MATQEVLKLGIDAAGKASSKSAGKVELADSVFDAPVKPRLFYEAVKYIQNLRRAGTASTKTRAFVRGGGKKPYKQKHTGRARHGSRRSPLWRGGAVLFGPLPKDWSYRINSKVKQNAIRAAVSARRKEGNLIMVDSIELPEIKTKYLIAMMDQLKIDNALIVDANPGKELVRSARNIPFVDVVDVKSLNVYDVLLHTHLVITAAARKVLEERLSI